MSIGADAIGESTIAAQASNTSSVKAPPKRTAVATTDTVAQPEPR